jgi:hypothetical protein
MPAFRRTTAKKFHGGHAMAEPLRVDVGTIALPDGRKCRCSVEIRLTLVVDGIGAGDRGAVLEDHFREVLERLIDRLGGPFVWHAALAKDHAERGRRRGRFGAGGMNARTRWRLVDWAAWLTLLLLMIATLVAVLVTLATRPGG